MSERATFLFRNAVDLFNRGSFFDAHEVWEDVWRSAPQSEKKFLQGLIQVAVAFHHRATGNFVGARSLLERGCRNLENCPQHKSSRENSGDVRLGALLDNLAPWRRVLAEGGPQPPLPRIQLIEP